MKSEASSEYAKLLINEKDRIVLEFSGLKAANFCEATLVVLHGYISHLLVCEPCLSKTHISKAQAEFMGDFVCNFLELRGYILDDRQSKHVH